MINSEILEEVIDTSLKEMFLSRAQIRKFVIEIIETLEDPTRCRFSSVRFSGQRWKDPEFATTDINRGIISFNLDTIYSTLKQRKNVIDSYLTCNLEILGIIVHEIQHLREPYKLTQNELDNILIKYGSIRYMQKRMRELHPNMSFEQFQRIYLKSFNYVPTERIAEIDSSKIIFDSVLKYPGFKDDNKTEFAIVRQNYILNNTGIYDKLDFPLKTYLKKIDRLDILEKFDEDFVDELSIGRKLRVGLNVNKLETHIFEKKIKAK